MTLLDFPGKVACTVFLGGCDFRCPFCHNFELAEGIAEPVMELSELLDFLDKRKGLLDGAAFTGGEPCLHRDLPELLLKIKDMGFQTKLDTNGYHPEILKQIIDTHAADYIAMDIKNSPEKYAETVGLPAVDLAPVRRSISLLMGGNTAYEFRTTVMKELHADEDMNGIGRMIQGAAAHYLQPFTDRDTVLYSGFSAPDEETLARWKTILSVYVGQVFMRGA